MLNYLCVGKSLPLTELSHCLGSGVISCHAHLLNLQRASATYIMPNLDAGLQFFPGYLNRSRQAFHDQKAFSWQHIGQQQLKEQRTLRLSSLFNPIRALEQPLDASASLSVLSPASSSSGQELLPTSSQLLESRVRLGECRKNSLTFLQQCYHQHPFEPLL